MKRMSLTKEKNKYAITNDVCKKREKELCAWGVPLEGLTVTGLLFFCSSFALGIIDHFREIEPWKGLYRYI